MADLWSWKPREDTATLACLWASCICKREGPDSFDPLVFAGAGAGAGAALGEGAGADA